MIAKLEQKIILFIIGCILSILIVIGVFAYYINSKIDTTLFQLTDNKTDTNKILMDNVNSAYEGINLVEKQANLILPRIHKNLNWKKTNEINKYDDFFYYYDYAYRYLVFDADSIFRRIYSGFSNEKLNYEIEQKFFSFIEDATIYNDLELGQTINKIVAINSDNYIFSMKYLFTRDGYVDKAVLVLIRLTYFIDIDNISRDNICIVNFYNDKLFSKNDTLYEKISPLFDIINSNQKNILETSDIKFAYRSNERMGVTVISYVNKKAEINNVDTFRTIYLPISCLLLTLVVLILVYYKWLLNKIKNTINHQNNNTVSDKIKLNDTTKNTDGANLIPISIDIINKLDKYKTTNTLINLSKNISELKKITRNVNRKMDAIKEANSIYKNLEMNGNILEINIAILCNQLNDNRLNDVLLMIKMLNQKLRDNNSNIIFTSEYNNLFAIYEKIDNSIELLTSFEKDRINTINLIVNDL